MLFACCCTLFYTGHMALSMRVRSARFGRQELDDFRAQLGRSLFEQHVTGSTYQSKLTLPTGAHDGLVNGARTDRRHERVAFAVQKQRRTSNGWSRAQQLPARVAQRHESHAFEYAGMFAKKLELALDMRGGGGLRMKDVAQRQAENEA